MKHNHTHKKLSWTILLNIIITLAEYIGGIASGSLALLSDAGHNLSDVLSLLLGYIGEKISEKKADKSHSFGYKRFEVLTALINALALLAIALYIIIEAFKRLNEERTISIGLMLGIGSIGLLGNLVSIIILHKEKEESLNMKSAYLHLFYDTLSSVFVMLSAVIIYFTNYIIVDIIASFIISIMIFYSSYGIIKNAIHIFMQGVPENISFDDVYMAIKKIGGVKSVHELHIWSINSKDNFLSCHICKNGNIETDKLIKKVNTILKKKFNIYHTTIQVEEENICNL